MKTTTALITTYILVFAMVLLTGCSGSNSENDMSGTNGTSSSSTVSMQDSESESLVYELRTYTTHDGKLEDLHQRFANHTMALFEKHGMTNIMYWSPQDPELSGNTLIYLLSHESREAAEQSWEGFLNDEEWRQVYEASRADGPIVERVESVFMTKTPYSP